jgi:Fibronectin type III domain
MPGVRRDRRLLTLLAVLALIAGLPGRALADPDTTAPTGTLTVGNGSGYVPSVDVPLHVPATDDVGVSVVRVFLAGQFVEEVPYAETIQVTVPEPQRQYQVYVQWWDAAGNGQGSEEITFIVDDTVPDHGQLRFYPDASASDDIMTATIINPGNGYPTTHVRFKSSSGAAWGTPIEVANPTDNPITVDWPMLDPTFGGSPTLGRRTVYYQIRNAAGTWSTTGSQPSGVAFEDAHLLVSGDIRTGHDVTFSTDLPDGVRYPSGTTCWWSLLWGDDPSLYEGNRDSTFGSIEVSGPVSKGYCDPWTVTLPWVPTPRFMVSFRAEVGGEPMVDVTLGSSPDAPDHVRPAIDSTSRKVTHSSLPIVYVLPEDYILALGQPTTYRAYAVGGAKITSHDLWTIEYIDTPEFHHGGTSVTFTPKKTGDLTVCWGSDTTKSTQMAACYDPPVKHRDRTKPTTSAPKLRFGTGAGGDVMPVEVSWSGKDVGWGVQSYRLERRVADGSWKKVTLPKAKTTSIVQALTTGTSYRYRIRATDKAGNVGAWKYLSTFKSRRTGDTSTSADLVYTGAWTSVADPTALGGLIHEASLSGDAVTFSFRGRAIVWLAERGPDHGSASVYIDGKLSNTVSLEYPTALPRRIAFRTSWSSVGNHTIKIVVAGTVGHPIVSLDGFAYLR